MDGHTYVILIINCITLLMIMIINRSAAGHEFTQPIWATTHLFILPRPMDTRRFGLGRDEDVDNDNDNGDIGGDDDVDNDNGNGDVIMSASQVVQLLLRHKADVNFVNEHGNSAMHYACFWGYTGGWSYLYNPHHNHFLSYDTQTLLRSLLTLAPSSRCRISTR